MDYQAISGQISLYDKLEIPEKAAQDKAMLPEEEEKNEL